MLSRLIEPARSALPLTAVAIAGVALLTLEVYYRYLQLKN